MINLFVSIDEFINYSHRLLVCSFFKHHDTSSPIKVAIQRRFKSSFPFHQAPYSIESPFLGNLSWHSQNISRTESSTIPFTSLQVLLQFAVAAVQSPFRVSFEYVCVIPILMSNSLYNADT